MKLVAALLLLAANAGAASISSGVCPDGQTWQIVGQYTTNPPRDVWGCSANQIKSITASVPFDENGRSVPSSVMEPCGTNTLLNCEKGEVAGTVYKIMEPPKEPAVVWCRMVETFDEPPNDRRPNQIGYWYEICGREDGSVFWRKK